MCFYEVAWDRVIQKLSSQDVVHQSFTSNFYSSVIQLCFSCQILISSWQKREMRERQKLKLKCADEKSYFLSSALVKIHLLTLSNALWHLICIPTAVSFAVSGLCIIQKQIMNAFQIPVHILNWIWIQSEKTKQNNAFISIWIQGSRIKMVEIQRITYICCKVKSSLY